MKGGRVLCSIGCSAVTEPEESAAALPVLSVCLSTFICLESLLSAERQVVFCTISHPFYTQGSEHPRMLITFDFF